MDSGFDRIQRILRIESTVAFLIAGLNPEKPKMIDRILNPDSQLRTLVRLSRGWEIRVLETKET